MGCGAADRLVEPDHHFEARRGGVVRLSGAVGLVEPDVVGVVPCACDACA